MAALAISQYYLGATIGDVHVFRHPAQVEGRKILEAVESFPRQVLDEIIVGQVAVDALDAAMRPGMKPGFIFGLHRMATAAKLRTLGFGIEARRSKSRQYPQDRRDCRRNQNIDQGFSLGKAHTHLRLKGGRQDQALQGVPMTTVPEGRHSNQNGRGASAPDDPVAEGSQTTPSCGAGYPNPCLGSKIKNYFKIVKSERFEVREIMGGTDGPGSREDKRKGFS